MSLMARGKKPLTTRKKLSATTTCAIMSVSLFTHSHPSTIDHRWQCMFTELDWPAATPKQMGQDWQCYRGATVRSICCTCGWIHSESEAPSLVYSIHPTPFFLAWYWNKHALLLTRQNQHAPPIPTSLIIDPLISRYLYMTQSSQEIIHHNLHAYQGFCAQDSEVVSKVVL